MKFHFFTIPVRDSKAAESELNTFCNQHRIVSVEKQFVANGDNSYWSLCLERVSNEDAPGKPHTSGNKVDYKQILNQSDFILFAKLRTLRKEIAEREGIPPYVVFTNEQLADIVRGRISTKAALLELKGVGTKRVDKYGDLFLAKMEAEGEVIRNEKDTDRTRIDSEQEQPDTGSAQSGAG